MCVVQEERNILDVQREERKKSVATIHAKLL